MSSKIFTVPLLRSVLFVVVIDDVIVLIAAVSVVFGLFVD